MQDQSRRAFVGAALAIPAFVVLGGSSAIGATPPQLSAPDRRKWQRRLALYKRRAFRAKEYRYGPYQLADRLYDTRRDAMPWTLSPDRTPEAWAAHQAALADYGPYVDRWGVLNGQSYDALRLLMATPAPELRDVQTKIALWVAETGELADGQPWPHILADLRRLG